MASVENRSRFIVSVKNRSDLTQTFSYNREEALKLYIAELKAAGYSPKLERANDKFAIRVREAGHVRQTLYASTVRCTVNNGHVRFKQPVPVC